jgi:hypothetical protein
MVIDITEISAIVAAAGVFVGVVYYILEIRHQTKIRETDLAIRMNPWMNVTGSELTNAIAAVWNLEYKDYSDFVERYGPYNLVKPENRALHMVMNYFEGVGLLLKRNLMTVDFAWDLYGSTCFMAWEKVKPLAIGIRRQYGTPDAWSNFEYLYNELKRKEQQTRIH